MKLAYIIGVVLCMAMLASSPVAGTAQDTWYCISGNNGGTFNGYNWTGTTWQADTTISGGLGDVGGGSSPTVFIENAPRPPAIPPAPTNLHYTTGNFYVRHTWNAGSGNVTDSYNVSVNNVWHNATGDTYYNDTYSAHGTQTIVVYAFNNSQGGTTSLTGLQGSATIPNNAVTIQDTEDIWVMAGNTGHVDINSTDADGDPPTYTCSRMDMFANFNPATGVGSWDVSCDGVYQVTFGVSDGHGSHDSDVMVITCAAYRINYTWNSVDGAGDDYVVAEYAANVQYIAHTTLPTTDWVWKVDGSTIQTGMNDSFNCSFDSCGRHCVTVDVIEQSGATDAYEWIVVVHRERASETVETFTDHSEDLFASIDGEPSFEDFCKTLAVPYTGAMGSIFYIFVFGMPMLMLYIRQDSMSAPITVVILFGSVILYMLPAQWHAIGGALMVLGLLGALFRIFKERER